MDAQERIIRKLFMEQHCHHCGRPYEPGRLLVLARRTELWMVMISCTDCEQKDTYVVKFPPQMHGRQRVTSYRLSKPPASTPLPEEPVTPMPTLPETPFPSEPVNADDVLDMHLFLKQFNGDFQRLFAEID
jgi:hypothetical protein